MALSPGQRDERLICELQECSLSDPPTFEALSYTWKTSQFDDVTSKSYPAGWKKRLMWKKAKDSKGKSPGPSEEDHTNEIFCGRKVLSIGPGLRTALLRLRHPVVKRYLWVDQICIDQNNLQERSHQVEHMRDIYAAAERVILWIGEADEFTVKAMNIIEKLAPMYRHPHLDRQELMEMVHGYEISTEEEIRSRFSQLNLNTVSYDDTPTPQIVAADKANGLPPRSEWVALTRFFNRPVFGRIWVVQEICAGKRVTVMCGDQRIPWLLLARVATLFQHHSWNAMFLDFHQSAKDFDLKLFDKTLSRITDVNWRRALFQQQSPTTWYEVMRLGRDFEASLPVDKVYAVLRIFDGDSSDLLVTPDYSLETATVFADVTKAIILADKSINILHCVCDRSFYSISGLPSWVPDYSLAASCGHSLVDRQGTTHYKAAGQSFMQVSWPSSTEPNVMSTPGYRVDKIKTISDEFNAEEVARTLLAWSLLASHSSDYPTGEDRASAFWRTCVGNSSESNVYPAPEACFNTFSVFAVGLYAAQGLNELKDRDLGYVFTMMMVKSLTGNYEDRNMYMTLATWLSFALYRRFYISENGYFGLCNRSARTGDEIYLLSGGSSPFVLRRDESNTQTNSVAFTFLGDTYMHGVMDGECLARDDFMWEEILLK